MDDATLKRFWLKINKSGPVPAHVPHLGPCWVWTGCKAHGYGMFRVARRMRRAHRVAWELATGTATSACVLHRCDNRACVRPEHLFSGSQQENIADREAKGRNKLSYGERHGHSRLTEAQVRAIRASTESLRQIGKRFGISSGHASRIRSRELWPHL